MPWINAVVAPADSPRNGFAPDANSYKTMPREKISLAAVMGRRRTSSGDKYPMVPAVNSSSARLAPAWRASPKSRTFTYPSGRSIRFSGLMSR